MKEEKLKLQNDKNRIIQRNINGNFSVQTWNGSSKLIFLKIMLARFVPCSSCMLIAHIAKEEMGVCSQYNCICFRSSFNQICLWNVLYIDKIWRCYRKLSSNLEFSFSSTLLFSEVLSAGGMWFSIQIVSMCGIAMNSRNVVKMKLIHMCEPRIRNKVTFFHRKAMTSELRRAVQKLHFQHFYFFISKQNEHRICQHKSFFSSSYTQFGWREGA